MMHARPVLLGSLLLVAAVFLGLWVRTARSCRERRWPTWIELAIGVGTDFFDTLGIGSFATTTSIYRFLGIVPDELIPGTLNVGHAPAAITEALIFSTIVAVDPLLLACMVAAAASGAWVGAGVVVRLPRRKIRWAMGTALLAAGLLLIAAIVGIMPGGGEALGLHGWKFGIAVVVNFILGGLMTIGIGIFAPCMLMLALLGMTPVAAFPIMMTSGALLQCVASERFLRSQRYGFGAATGLAAGGVVGVLAAAALVRSLPIAALRWLVAAVVIYTAVALLRAAAMRDPQTVGSPAGVNG